MTSENKPEAREKQIEDAAHAFDDEVCKSYEGYTDEFSFIAGAKWADANPKPEPKKKRWPDELIELLQEIVPQSESDAGEIESAIIKGADARQYRNGQAEENTIRYRCYAEGFRDSWKATSAKAEKDIEHWKSELTKQIQIAQRQAEEIAEAKTRIKILENPSDGRCMEIGALRTQNAELKAKLDDIHYRIKAGTCLGILNSGPTRREAKLLELRQQARDYLLASVQTVVPQDAKEKLVWKAVETLDAMKQAFEAKSAKGDERG